MEPTILGPDGQPIKPGEGQVLIGVTEISRSKLVISMTYGNVESCWILNSSQAETLQALLAAFSQDIKERQERQAE